MKGRSSLLFAKKAEPLLFVFLLVLLPFAGTGLAGDGDDAGGQGLRPTGCWRALGAGGHLVLIRGDGRGDGLHPRVHFLLDKEEARGRLSQQGRARNALAPAARPGGLGTGLTRGEQLPREPLLNQGRRGTPARLSRGLGSQCLRPALWYTVPCAWRSRKTGLHL